ncbi:MAG: helix-turn-helix transcriptional regulator [Coriobacteriales bacterium]|nr:helix-turn-helix transcriptional regulator [Coriobacteriales bacterium]MBQ6586423.1 helix-turn-helix transcriptional regulator [Coriobacteriales bacterium]
MAVKKQGDLVKEARVAAGLTQEQLARKVKNCTATDIGKCERKEKNLTQEQLKQIAKATGVTQKSLLEAPKNVKTTSSSSSSSSSGKTSSSSSSSSGTSMKVTATEKKLVEAYRAADSDARKAAMKILKGEKDSASDILESVLNSLLKGKISGKSGVAEAEEGSGPGASLVQSLLSTLGSAQTSGKKKSDDGIDFAEILFSMLSKK